jgi:TonB family protein
MLKRVLTAILLTVLGVQITTPGQTTGGLADWKRFRVAGEHFSILLPALPVVIQRGQSGQMPVGVPPFGLPVRKAANSYSAYHDGVVYLLIYFANPKHDEQLEFFLEKQLKVNELRNADVGTANETSENGRRVLTYQFNKYDFRRSFHYPGTLKLVDDKDRTFALLAIGKDRADASVAQVLQSLEVGDKPAGIDIGSGGSNASDVRESADTIVSSSTASTKAMIIVKPEPRYPEAARRKQLRGSVTLKLVLSASGKITNIEPVAGVPDFYGTSISAAGKIFFIPAMKDGRFVSTQVEVVYNFNLY